MLLRLFCIFILLFVPTQVSGTIINSAAPPHPAKIMTGLHEENNAIRQGVYPSPASIRHAIAATGTLEVLFLRCEFQPDTDPETTGDGLMTRTKTEITTFGTDFDRYWFENSYGKLETRVTVSDQVYQASRTMSYYGLGTLSSSRLIELLREVVALADADIDFSTFDAIVLVHAGYGQEADIARQGLGDTPNDIWSMYIDGFVENRDGIQITSFTVAPERQDQDNHPENGALGILAHEFGHQLGLVDLYDIDGSSSGIGDWGLMGHGAWLDAGKTPAMPCAWSRKYLNWTTTVIWDGVTPTNSLGCAGTQNTLLLIPVDPDKPADEYFLLENRCQTGWDLHQGGGGILIWHIDESVGSISANNVNATDAHRRVDLECANGFDNSGLDDLDYRDDSHPYTSKDHPFYLSGKNRFTSTTNPSSLAYGELTGDIAIRFTSEPASNMNFTVQRASGTLAAAEQISEAWIYPNPVRGNTCRFHYNLHFAPQNTEVRIYNTGGKLVNRFTGSNLQGENDVVFFPFDKGGNFLKNGTYFFKISSTTTTGSTVECQGRFAVIR